MLKASPCEQSGTESNVMTCHAKTLLRHNPAFGETARDKMELNFRRFSKRISRKLALIINRFKLVATFEDRDFGAQRMCPFCGLITSRRKTCCLECGKTLEPA